MSGFSGLDKASIRQDEDAASQLPQHESRPVADAIFSSWYRKWLSKPQSEARISPKGFDKRKISPRFVGD